MYLRGLSLLWLNVIISRIIHVVLCIVFSFYCWLGFHSVVKPQFLYLFPCWWTFGLFQVFSSVTNKASMNIPIQTFPATYFFFFLTLVTYLGLEWLDYMVGVRLTLLEAAKLFSKVNIIFYVTIRKAWEFQVLRLLASIRIVSYLTVVILPCIIECHCVINVHFPRIFMKCLFWILPIFIRLLLLVLDFNIICSTCKSIIRYMLSKYFSPSLCLGFSLIW